MAIDRPCTAAYWPPSVDSARPSVTNATEGAAPKRPAKLFGRNMSPSNANAETTMPPAKKRMMYSKAFPLSDAPSLKTVLGAARFPGALARIGLIFQTTANNLQRSRRFDGEPPKAVLRDFGTIDWILGG